ncbi:MAG: SIR2 family protein [Phycisphaerales bacterium]|nr:MAG: SIR2 family protein [Phycisphaerales bacterium]
MAADHSYGIKTLKSDYKNAADNTFGLYLGAGVNLYPPGWNKHYPKSCGEPFPVYAWKDLLRKLYQANEHRPRIRFDTLAQKHEPDQDWPGLAQDVCKGMQDAEITKSLDQIIYSCMSRESKYKQSRKCFLDQAPTLHAAICFATAIKEKKPDHVKSRFQRNRRVEIVITPNYDYFFGAGWTLYEAFKKQWCHQTPYKQSARKYREQGLICSIHGYLPYDPKTDRDRKIVLTRDSYKKAYASPTVQTGGWTTYEQARSEGKFADYVLWKAINEYQLIFIGTSFIDKPLCNMLAAYKGKRRHFAIVRKSENELIERVNRLGITPVMVKEFIEVPDRLRGVYCAGLNDDDRKKAGFDKPTDYWERLWLGKTNPKS